MTGNLPAHNCRLLHSPSTSQEPLCLPSCHSVSVVKHAHCPSPSLLVGSTGSTPTLCNPRPLLPILWSPDSPLQAAASTCQYISPRPTYEAEECHECWQPHSLTNSLCTLGHRIPAANKTTKHQLNFQRYSKKLQNWWAGRHDEGCQAPLPRQQEQQEQPALVAGRQRAPKLGICMRSRLQIVLTGSWRLTGQLKPPSTTKPYSYNHPVGPCLTLYPCQQLTAHLLKSGMLSDRVAQ